MSDDRRTLEDIPGMGRGMAESMRIGITAGITAAQEAGAGAEVAVIEQRAEALVLENMWPAMHQPVFGYESPLRQQRGEIVVGAVLNVPRVMNMATTMVCLAPLAVILLPFALIVCLAGVSQPAGD